MQYQKHLLALRRTLAKNQMSLLVGAGFSKNVSGLFPDWRYLLKDLVGELYQDEMDKELDMLFLSDEEYPAAREKWIFKKASKVGYLEVVSSYAQHTGLLESIVTYIEERTPIIEALDGHYYLLNDGVRELLTADKLALHSMLLTLPWNNVYTTNYDPLLEASVNTSAFEEIEKENILIQKEVEGILIQMDKKVKQIDELSREIAGLQEEIQKIGDDTPKADSDALKEKILQISRDRGKNRIEVGQLKAREGEKNAQYIANLERQQGCFTVVTDALELRVKRNRNIIKLHGSLRSEKQREEHYFEFDNDPNKQYIISTEHYKDYPTKHEAFTQLMRITLLQESYCLIGFSGSDPNFLAWIGWIKDLLYKHAARLKQRRDTDKENKLEKEYKIYLIDVSNEELTRDRMLFNENHSIIRIPLMNAEVQQYLQKETGKPIDPGNKYWSSLQLLFEYLSQSDSIKLLIEPKNSLAEKDWYNGWKDLVLHDTKVNRFFIKNIGITTLLNRQLANASSSFLPFVEQYRSLDMDHFLFAFSSDIIAEPNVDFRFAKMYLALLAVSKSYYMIRNTFCDQEIERFQNEPTLAAIIGPMLERNDVFKGRNLSEHHVAHDPFNKVLFKLFNFQLEEAHALLLEWEPTVDKLHLKAGLLSLFDIDDACLLVEQQLADISISNERRFNSLELLDFFRLNMGAPQPTAAALQAKHYENAGYGSAMDILDSIAKDLKEKEAKVKRYGAGRFTYSNTLDLRGDGEKQKAFQYLMILADFALPLSLGRRVLQSSEEWYNVFKLGFEHYPFPFIFYSLQYNADDVLGRVGQDVAFSHHLIHDHELILTSVMDSYFLQNERLKESSLIFLTEMLTVVSPIIWQERFLKVWHSLIERKVAFAKVSKSAELFVRKAIAFTESMNILYRFVEDVLEGYFTNADAAINYLYYLNQNKIFKKHGGDAVPSALTMSIDHFILQIQQVPHKNLLVLTNISYLLNKQQKSAIIHELKILQFDKIKDHFSTYKIILYFAEGNAVLLGKLKTQVFASKEAWNFGINGQQLSSFDSSIPVFLLTDKNVPNSGLPLLREDILTLYYQLKNELKTFTTWMEGRQWKINDLGFDVGHNLDDMLLYLHFYKDELGGEPGYDETYRTVSLYSFKAKGYDNLLQGMTSHSGNQLLHALNDLGMSIFMGQDGTAILQVLLNKILLQSEPSLEEAMRRFVQWVEAGSIKDLGRFEHLLSEILTKYNYAFPINCDRAYVEESLVRLAYAMDKAGLYKPIITEWMERGTETHFTNVRHWLMANGFTGLGRF